MARTDLENEKALNKIRVKIDPDADEREAFRQLVDRMGDSDKPVYATNNKPWQSRVAVFKIANIAVNENVPMKMFIGNPECEFYDVDNFFSLLEQVDKSAGATIVLAEKPTGSILAKWMAIDNLDNIEVHYKPKYDDSMHHVCVAGRAYRIESPHKKSPPLSQVDDMFPQRPARFGFGREADLKGINYYWEEQVFTDCFPLRPIAN